MYVEIRHQIEDQLSSIRATHTQYPVIIRVNGEERLIFASFKRIHKTGCDTIHIEKLSKQPVSGKNRLILKYFQLTRQNTLLSDGYELISKQDALGWIERHKTLSGTLAEQKKE